ncbi:MAG: metalloregulator ArsR/SmtB family transcription factor [Anaerolineales bacterium]
MNASRQVRLVQVLKVLAEPNRLALLDQIIRGYQCNCQLGDELGLPANLISHHLGVLRDADLIVSERDALDARWVYYSVNKATLKALNDAFSAFFDIERVQPRRLTCGPQVALAESDGLAMRDDGRPG